MNVCFFFLFVRVSSHQAVGLLYIRRLRLRLSVVLLPRSVDVVEQCHGEGHSQELQKKGEEDCDLYGLSISVHYFVTVYVFVCGLFDGDSFLGPINPAVKHKHVLVHSLFFRWPLK